MSHRLSSPPGHHPHAAAISTAAGQGPGYTTFGHRDPPP